MIPRVPWGDPAWGTGFLQGSGREGGWGPHWTGSNTPTEGSTDFGMIWGSFWHHFGIVLRSLSDHFGDCVLVFRVIRGSLRALPWPKKQIGRDVVDGGAEWGRWGEGGTEKTFKPQTTLTN